MENQKQTSFTFEIDEGDATANGTFDYYGFQILHSQVCSVAELFVKHPDIAVNVRQKNQRLKTAYLNILLDLIKTLNKPPHSITETELSNARSELVDLTEAGFKLDFLKTKVDEVSLERKKRNAADGSRVQELEEHIKNLKVELSEEKIKTATVSDLKDELNKEMCNSAARVLSLEQTVADLKYELNKEKRESAAKVLSLEHTVSNLEEEVWVREDEVSDLEDVLNKEKGKSDTCAAKVLSLEQTVSDLEDEVSDLNDEVSDLKDELNKEKGNSNTCAAQVLSLKQTVSDLKDELNKEKHESDSSVAKVLSLEQTVLNLKDVLNKEKGKSDTFAAKVLSLEQTVLNLTAELKEEKGVASSWEVLDYDDLHNEK